MGPGRRLGGAELWRRRFLGIKNEERDIEDEGRYAFLQCNLRKSHMVMKCVSNGAHAVGERSE
jgi:hypothetical protein